MRVRIHLPDSRFEGVGSIHLGLLVPALKRENCHFPREGCGRSGRGLGPSALIARERWVAMRLLGPGRRQSSRECLDHRGLRMQTW